MAKKRKKQSKSTKTEAPEPVSNVKERLSRLEPTTPAPIDNDGARDEIVRERGLTEAEGAERIREGLTEKDGANLRDRLGDVPEVDEEDLDLEALEALEETGEEDGDDDEAEPDPDALRLDVEELGEALVPVRIDGETEWVPLDESLKGYQRQRAFTRKTQELAEQRRETAAVREQAAGIAADLERQIESLGTVLQNNPQLAEAYRYVTAQRQALEAYQLQETLDQESAILREELGWDDPETETAEKTRIAEGLMSVYGIDEETISSLRDHRAVLIASDALKYRELADKRDEMGSRKSKSPTLKPGTSGRKRVKKSAKAAKAARKKLARTGSIDDAAKAIEGLLS